MINKYLLISTVYSVIVRPCSLLPCVVPRRC